MLRNKNIAEYYFITNFVLVLVTLTVILISILTYGNWRILSPSSNPNVTNSYTSTDYQYSLTPPISFGELSDPTNSYISLRLDFYVEHQGDHQNIFQTAPGNEGLRLEITDNNATFVIADRSSPNGIKIFTLSTDINRNQWYELHIWCKNGEYFSATFNGKHIIDYKSTGIELNGSEVLIGQGFDQSRKFQGLIKNIFFEIGKYSGRVLIKQFSKLKNAILLTGIFTLLIILFFVCIRKFIIFNNSSSLEVIFIALFTYVISIAYYLYVLIYSGYLPSPFIYIKSETFMDFFNSLYWAYDNNRYLVGESNYPPLNFVLLKIINSITFAGLTDFTILNTSVPFAHSMAGTIRDIFILKFFIISSYLIIPIIIINMKYWSDINKNEKIIFYFLIILSTPLLFTLERGNLILICPLFIGLLLTNRQILSSISAAILINIKQYFVIIVLKKIITRKWIDFYKIIIFLIFIYLISMYYIGNHIHEFFISIYSFSSNKAIFSTQEIMALPSSLSSFQSFLYSDNSCFVELFSKSFNSTKRILLVINFIEFLIFTFTILVFISKCKIDCNINILLLICLLTNLTYKIGGYTLIFYYPFIPIFLKMKNRAACLSILFLMGLPLDILPLIECDNGTQYSYLMNLSIDNPTWILGYGSFIRPVLNLILLFQESRLLSKSYFISLP